MTKRNKIIYWISTTWLKLGMLSGGIVQLFKVKKISDFKIPREFQNKLNNSPALKKAFDALTPGCQRA